VRGVDGAAPLELAVQQAIGRVFVANYRATPETWQAAQFLNAAARAPNPLAPIFWRLTGRLERAQQALAHAVNGVPAGVHATGVAVHTLLRSFTTMRDLLRDPGEVDRLSPDAALARCLGAPYTVMRQVSGPAGAPDDLPPGTLALFELEAARAHDPGPEVVFLAGSWSECPASRWTPALLRAVWSRAVVAAKGAP
jgi:hypothetical protein